MRLPLGRDRIHVHYQQTDGLAETALAAAADWLSPEERARAARFVRTTDRRDFVAAHALLRGVLSLYSAVSPSRWAFETGAFGKPRLAAALAGSAELSFNLSHTRGLAVCAIAAGDVDLGVDVESTQRPVEVMDLASRFFASREVAELERCPDTERPTRFVEMWTLKEAALKALGTGLSSGIDAFVVSLGAPSSPAVQAPVAEEPERWHFALAAPTPGDRIGVAVRAASPRRWRVLALRHDGVCGPVIDVQTVAGIPARRF